ncbi:hypothetical protein EPA93_37430 [Ktedonosporobacter rubrisoli]|uniref:PPM-type phosphatase domain-containing protein n=1 Tax=Ktedonosporobacter rubrisoli TaxID=2509675 RepID=A0A4P6K1K7_KTERU|nr:protein phosphatase 2C domain-containing protein [Ktedonosporobacter rubrisoli]QBD81356.1 hypothetical protein EPA93_37430 [Ktedonosporobacter rubrisoli]
MSTHSFKTTRKRRASWYACSILGGFLIALQAVLVSPTAFAASTSVADMPRDVVRPGVSVVRLIASYTQAETENRPAPNEIKCTGLGVLIDSWPSTNSSDQNNWILTDGNLVGSSGEVSCISSHPAAKLSSVELIFSNLYNPEFIAYTLSVPLTIRCLKDNNCSNGPALFAFNTDSAHTLPFLSIANTNTASAHGIELTKSSSSLSTPPLANNNNAALNAQYEQVARQFLSPNSIALNTMQGSEPGTPLVNQDGELTGLHLQDSASLTLSDIKQFLKQQPELAVPHLNTVADSWARGITDYYQLKNYTDAHIAFQSAAQANPQFAAAADFAKLSLNAAGSGEQRNPSLDQQQNSISLFGLSLPLWLLSIVGLGILIGLLILASLLFGRSRALRKRREHALNAEYAEAERKAAIDAERIAAMEAQQQTWTQPTAPIPNETPASVSNASTHPLPTEELHCPRCGEPVLKGANYCSNCRLFLSPSESGLHLRIPPLLLQQPTAPIVPNNSIAEQPTIEMRPEAARNGQTNQIDKEATMHFAPIQSQDELSATIIPLDTRASTRTNPGIKRKHKPNEDSHFAAQGTLNISSHPLRFGLFVVADGMGGHANGQDASRRAIQTIADFMLPRLIKEVDIQDSAPGQLLAEAVQSANLAVHQNNMELHADMGTTVTAAFVVGSTAYVTNVGDSRTYLYRLSQGLRKITLDHSVVASLVEAGIIKPDDIYTHPKRNQIYRSLGEKPNVEVDLFTVPLELGDKLILCSDGLWDMVRDPKIEETIKSHTDNSEECAEALIQAALDGGGEDNVTVIVAEIIKASKQTPITGIQLLAKPETVQIPQL